MKAATGNRDSLRTSSIKLREGENEKASPLNRARTGEIEFTSRKIKRGELSCQDDLQAGVTKQAHMGD